MSDLNLTVLSGRLATDPEYRQLDSGTMVTRLLVTIRSETPRKRVDVVPVTYWGFLEDDITTELRQGEHVWIAGSVQRRFWEAPDGRRSRLEVVADQVTVKSRVYECEGCVHGEHDSNCLAGSRS